MTGELVDHFEQVLRAQPVDEDCGVEAAGDHEVGLGVHTQRVPGMAGQHVGQLGAQLAGITQDQLVHCHLGTWRNINILNTISHNLLPIVMRTLLLTILTW